MLIYLINFSLLILPFWTLCVGLIPINVFNVLVVILLFHKLIGTVIRCIHFLRICNRLVGFFIGIIRLNAAYIFSDFAANFITERVINYLGAYYTLELFSKHFDECLLLILDILDSWIDCKTSVISYFVVVRFVEAAQFALVGHLIAL